MSLHVALVLGWCVGIAACTNVPSTEGEEDFFAKVEQAAYERVVRSELVAVDSLNLSDYGIFNAQDIVVDEHRIYVNDSQLQKVVAIAKDDHSSFQFIGQGPGEGPGEVVRSSGWGVSSQHLFWANKPSRIARYSIEGAFLNEIEIDRSPTRLAVTEDSKLLSFSSMSDDYLFALMHPDGKLIRKVARVRDADKESALYRSLRYSGFVDYHDGHFYYAGYSESLIKKYTIEGGLVFSVSTIDNHPSELNYTETIGESVRIASYSPHALYASVSVVAYDGHIWIHPVVDDDGARLRYLDVYSASNGEYVESFLFRKPPVRYDVDDNHIYVVQTDRNPEPGERDFYVKIYDNMLGSR